MLDFTEGWAWFVGGLGATLLVMLALVIVILFGWRSAQHAQRRRTIGEADDRQRTRA